MRILIIGANSFIARNFIANLIHSNLDFEIIGTVRERERAISEINKNAFNINNLEKKIELIDIDLTNFDFRNFPSKVDWVFYFAQSRNYKNFKDSADEILEINLNAVNKIAFWSWRNNINSFVYFSTGGVNVLPKFNFVNYNHKLRKNIDNSNDFYLKTKLCAELILSSYLNLFEKIIIFRPFFVYGPFENFNMLIPRLIKNIYFNQPVYLTSKNGIKINPIFIIDAVEIIKKVVINQNLKGNYVFDIAGKDIITIKQLSIYIANLIKKNVKFEYIKNNHLKPKNIIGNYLQVCNLINFEFKYNILDGLKITVDNFIKEIE